MSAQPKDDNSTSKVGEKPATPSVVDLDAQRANMWQSHLQLTKMGNIKPLLFNALVALREAEVWRGTLRYDASALVTFIHRPTPWDRKKPVPRRWTDRDNSKLCEWLQRNNINVSSSIAAEAAQTIADERQYHPIRDYLTGLDWDGKYRLAEWLHFYMGAERTKYTEAIGLRWAVSAVARIMEPGCQADHVLVLQGVQGLGKSSLLRLLAGDKWFSDEVRDFGNKDTSMLLAGKWIIELAELEGMSDASTQRCKAFISRRVDQYRPPYGRHTVDVDRQCVFAATTNQDAFLKDETGNRRYWPVVCTRFDKDNLARDRNQFWAEAKWHYEQKPAVWWLDTSELRQMADAEQETRFESDPWEEKVEEFLSGKKEATPEEILITQLGFDLGGVRKLERNRVCAIMRHLKWERIQVRGGGGRGARIWRPKP